MDPTHSHVCVAFEPERSRLFCAASVYILLLQQVDNKVFIELHSA